MHALKIIGLFALFYALASLASNYLAARDDSDPPGGRSGMLIFTDHLTGCQYLSRPFYSSLTPRLGADGKQVCRGAK